MSVSEPERNPAFKEYVTNVQARAAASDKLYDEFIKKETVETPSIIPSAEALIVVHDAMTAKHGTDLPDYVYELKDKDGNPTGVNFLNFIKYSEHLSASFNIINFKKTLYIYDTKSCLYKQNVNEIGTEVRETFVKYKIAGKLSKALNEVNYHLQNMGNYSEYPFNTSPDCIPCRNGIIKINGSVIEKLPHGPEHLFTYKLNVDYDPSIGKCKIMRLLEQWVDKEKAAVLLQIPAQALLQMQLGHPYKKAYLLQGQAHAGKSSVLDLLKDYMFTSEHVSAIRLQQICTDRFASGQMEGKLLNIYDDLEDVPLETVDAFKTLTGSCSHGIERKFQDGYTGKVSCVHVFSCNYPPEYPPKVKRDNAFWERWEYVIFPNLYPVDPNFYGRTFTEELKSSFFNAIIWAMIYIRKNGLLVQSDVQTVMESWSINSDPLYDFITRKFNPGDGKTANRYRKQDLFNLYLKFCNDENIPEHKRKNTITSFTQAMHPNGFYAKRSTFNKQRNVEVYETSSWVLIGDPTPDQQKTVE